MPRQTEKWANIRLKDNIPDDVRTEGKDDAARIIREKIDNNQWPMQLTKLADECEWSRSHLKNTLSDYFEQVDENQTTEQNGKQIKIPDDVNEEDYLRGWINGRQSAK